MAVPQKAQLSTPELYTAKNVKIVNFTCILQFKKKKKKTTQKTEDGGGKVLTRST